MRCILSARLVLLAACSSAIWIGCQSEQAEPIDLVAPVLLTKVEPRDLEDRIMASGQLLAPNRAEVAAQVAGEITAVAIDEGEPAGAGEVVLEIDRERRSLEIAVARARVNEAGAHVAELRRELKRMRKVPTYRSSIATLEEISCENVYFDLKRPRDDVIGMLPLGVVGLHITAYLARRFGSRRRAGEGVCATEAMQLLGMRSQKSWSAGEKLAWRRWSPLVLILPGIERWSAAEKRALVAVVRAKGGRRESDFVLLFDRHRKLRRAVTKLALDDLS